MIAFSKVQVLPARDKVASALREAIITGQLAKGAQLSLKSIAESLGVSVTPVREALQILEREGFVELRPNRGAIVLGMDAQKIREHYEIREILESEAVKRFCGNKEALAELRSVFDEAKFQLEQGNYGQYSELNQKFHETIWRGADNRKMFEILAGLWNGLSIGSQTSREEYAAKSLREHAELLEAMERGDVDKTVSLMRGHIGRSCRDALSHMNG